MEIRPARVEDARDIAYLINLAGEGMPFYLWSQGCDEGEDALEIGVQRAARSSGNFSYRNVHVIEDNDSVAGMVLGYLQPKPYDLSNLTDYPEIVRPAVELEAVAAGSWYVNAIATYRDHRGKGIATTLLAASEQYAVAAGTNTISLIVASENEGAKRLYEQTGYHVIDKRPVVAYEGCLHGGDWLLMIKALRYIPPDWTITTPKTPTPSAFSNGTH